MMFLYIISLLYLVQLVASRPLTEREATNKKIHEVLLKSERKNADPSQFTWIDRFQADIESTTQEYYKTKTQETKVDIVDVTPEPIKNCHKKNSQRFQEIISDLNRIYSHSVRHILKENGHTTKNHKANHSSKTRTRYKNKTTQPIGRLQKYSNGTDEVTPTTSSTVSLSESSNKRKCRNRLRNIEKYLIRSAKAHPKESAVESTEATSTTSLPAFESNTSKLEVSTVKLVITVSEPLMQDITRKEAKETVEYTQLTVTKKQNATSEESLKSVNNAITSTTTTKMAQPINANIDQTDTIKVNDYTDKTTNLFSFSNKNKNSMELYTPKYVSSQDWIDLNTIEEEINGVPNYMSRTDTIEDILNKISEEIPLKVIEDSTEAQLNVKNNEKIEGITKMGMSLLSTLTTGISINEDVLSTIKTTPKQIADTTDIYLIVNPKDKSLKGCFTIQAQPNKDKMKETTKEYEESSATSITMRNAIDQIETDKQENINKLCQKFIFKQKKLKESSNGNKTNLHKPNQKNVIQNNKGSQLQVINLPNVPYVTHVKQNQTIRNDRVQDLYKDIFSKDKQKSIFKKINGEVLPKNVISSKAHNAHATKISKANQSSLREDTNAVLTDKAKEPSITDDTNLQDKSSSNEHKPKKGHSNTPHANATVPETANIPKDVKDKAKKKKISDLYKEINKNHGNKSCDGNCDGKIMKHMTWKNIKKFFGHDRVCSCKCKPNKTMCRACAASDAVMRELTFEFTNLAQYMKDHCTEIQTYFWMNPSGGKKLRDSVHKIDKSLNDYYKRIKGKCEGRTCETFATYLDKRHGANEKNGKTLDVTGKPHNQ